MLGWDVGYVWPLLENVVNHQANRPVDSWQLVMGNPSEASSPQPTTTPPRPPPPPPPPQRTDPPPYESIAETDSTTASSNNNNSGASGNGEGGRRRTRTRTSVSANRTRSGTGGSRRSRPSTWPHKASSVFACLCCVIGVSNVSRFSLLVYIYKGCFIFQFLLLSFIIGIPLLYFQMCLGQFLGAGMLDMWFISPAFKGLGFAMLYMYIIIGVCNAVPLSWLFIYFKDSFITLKDSFKWGKCHYSFARNGCLRALNSSSADFYGWSVPSYFHGRVLGRKAGEYLIGELKFEVAFNLCLVWIIVFICLSRGPKTFGKVVYVFVLFPIFLLMMVTMRMGQQWSEGIVDIFMSAWKPVLLDSNAWWLAAREAFITWGLMGTVALHICSRNKTTTNITKSLIAIIVFSVTVLITSSFLFACSANVLHKRNLSLAISSYEEESTVRVLKPGLWYHKNTSVTSLLFGVNIIPKDTFAYQSGYQVLRLVTETFPAALAVEGVRSISSFWSICFYSAMIMFGLGQQVVMWYCVVESLIAVNSKIFKAWHTTLTFITCNLAFLLGLPITSNMGIYIVYFLDFSLSSLWWIVLMYFIMIFAVLYIRGRPYGTDQLIHVVSPCPIMKAKLLPFFTFIWNILIPLSFLLMTISFLKTSSMDPYSPMGELMDNYRYWQRWAKTLNLCIQIFPLAIIITVCAYQAYKIFTIKGDLSFQERMKLLCCPVVSHLPARRSLESGSSNQGSTNSAFLDDPPPKYTPPPSYSTATSRMLAKQLQNSSLEEAEPATGSSSSNEMLTKQSPSCSVEVELSDADSASGGTISSTDQILPLQTCPDVLPKANAAR